MARPAQDYKIVKDNTSSYNLIAHERHVPDSPLFGPNPTQQQQGRDDRDDRRDDYGRGDFRGRRNDDDEREQRQRELQMMRQKKEAEYRMRMLHATNAIANDRHVPDSPLYRPGDATGRNQGYDDGRDRDRDYDQRRGRGDDTYRGEDPRFGSAQIGRDYERERDIKSGQVRKAFAGMYSDSMTKNKSVFDSDAEKDGKRTRDDYSNVKDGYTPRFGGIREQKHIPASPLYLPDQDTARSQNKASDADRRNANQSPAGDAIEDPRVGSAQKKDEDGQRRFHAPGYQVPMKDDDDDDEKYKQGGFLQYRGDYTDKPDSPDKTIFYRGGNPWTQKKEYVDIADPRYGNTGGQLIGQGQSKGGRSGGVLFFIKFPSGQGENLVVASHAFIRAKTADNGGRFLGMAKKVYDFGYEKASRQAMGVYHFPSMEKGFHFVQMDPILKQHDFPGPNGHSEMFMVCNAYLPDNLDQFSTFLLSEITLHDGVEKREYFEKVQKPFESYLFKNGAMPYVVCSYGSYDRKPVRRHMHPNNAIVTLHLFQGLEHLNYITNDDDYCRFRSLHNQMANEKCSIFTISKETGL